MSKSKTKGANVILAVTTVLLCGSVVINVELAERLRRANFRQEISELDRKLSPGDMVLDIEAREMNGTPTIYFYADSEDERPTILYVFSPTCGWCTKNLANLQALSESTSNDYRFVAISISDKGLEEYTAAQKWRFPILRNPTVATFLSHKFGPTPQTIIVSKDRRIVKNWLGAYSSDIKADIENFFNTKLPGVTNEDLVALE